MQTLYTLSTRDSVKPGEPQALLQKHFDHSKDLLQYLIYFITEVAAYAEKDAYMRSNRHVPSAQDLNVNTKIAGNQWLWKIREDASLRAVWDVAKPQNMIDRELVKKIYKELATTETYKTYISTEERNKKGEQDILLYIFDDLLLKNESFISHMEEHFSNWDDDAEMTIQLVKAYLQKPGSADFSQVVSADKLLFARSLLSTVIDKNEHLLELILPRLKNWDAERLAALDMILMKMGVAEFLYFETIPPKVTINEYIELAKEYSTDQSGQFVNGILDNIHKDLVEQGKLHKTEFKRS